MAQDRDLYQDGIFDVFSIQDLESIQKNGHINILANTKDFIMIEVGCDFWKIDLKEEEMIQYKDFISLQKDIDGKKVYSKKDPTQNQDYGAVLYDTVLETDIKDFPVFSLQERQQYFQGTSKGIIQYSMKGEYEKSLEKNRRKTQEFSNNALEPLNNKDTKIFYDALYITMDVLSIFYTFFNQKYKELKKEKIINNIIEKLDSKELDIKEVLNDKFLNEKLPELKFVLDKWSKNIKQIKIETSTTVDKALAEQKKNQQSQEIKTFIKNLVDDQELNQVSEKLSQQKDFNSLKTEMFFKELDMKIVGELGEDFKDKIKTAFEKSDEKDPVNFAYKQIVDDEIVQEIQQKHPNVTPQECGIVMSYLNAIIDDDKNIDMNKSIFGSKIEENKIDKIMDSDSKQTFDIAVDLLRKVIEKIEKTVVQTQEKQM